MPSEPLLRRTVSARLGLEVSTPSAIDLRVAAADRDLVDTESLVITSAGAAVTAEIVKIPGEGEVQRFHAAVGLLDIAYDASTIGHAAAQTVTAADEIVYLRPSRYAESDRLVAVARAEFVGIDTPTDLLAAVSSWVGDQLMYVPGSSKPTDGAVTTMLQRRGVCRDYAHLVVALLRALDVPARLAAVYAPGLDPMDFHAVAEAAVDGIWYVVDATLLAPRSTLLRICTGRDAADTAFLSSYGGIVDLRWMEVTATSEGDLPADDVTELVSLG
jgi:transglutaminase-like putative cysteine protease